jgi:cytochrome c peroxidase
VWLGSLSVAPSGTGVAQSRPTSAAHAAENRALDRDLARVLDDAGFSGAIESTLEQRLGRPIDRRLADLGRLLWFDTLHSLHGDNTCGGCHSPTNGFGDSQGIAIGVQNNSVVGADRRGPRNQRRSPLVIKRRQQALRRCARASR